MYPLGVPFWNCRWISNFPASGLVALLMVVVVECWPLNTNNHHLHQNSCDYFQASRWGFLMFLYRRTEGEGHQKLTWDSSLSFLLLSTSSMCLKAWELEYIKVEGCLKGRHHLSVPLWRSYYPCWHWTLLLYSCLGVILILISHCLPILYK